MWEVVKPLFGGQISRSQLEGLDLIRDASAGLPIKHRAYILATGYHETGGTMQPVREAFGSSDEDTIARLDRAFAKGQLKWVSKPYWRRDKDGKAWFGRGLVQLTFKDNYRRAGDKIGVDLVGNPDLALHPEVSVRILVRGMVEGWFTGKRLADFDIYHDMRRVVNGTDRAGVIAAHAEKFETALRGQPEPSKAHDPNLPPEARGEAPKPKGLLAAIIAAVVGFFVFIINKLGDD